MQATVLDEPGKAVTMLMGCYGIGVTRVVAAAIEQNHDDNGIIWPEAIAPFQVVLVPINYQKSARVRDVADALYAEFGAAGIDVLLDDRDARPGRQVRRLGAASASRTGSSSASAGSTPAHLEYRHRARQRSEEIRVADALDHVAQRTPTG